MPFKCILLWIAAAILMAPVPVTQQNGSDVAGTVPRVLAASGDNDAKSAECTFGDAAADAVRNSLGTDFAIVCGGDLQQNLLPGEITYDELKAAFKEDRQLAVASVTPKKLRLILEAGLSHVTIDKTEKIDRAASAFDGFPQIAGFTLRYDTTAPPGARIRELKVNKKTIDLDDDTTAYTLAATDFMFGGGYGLPAVGGAISTEWTLSLSMASCLNREMPDYSRTGGRISPMGTRDSSLSSLYPMGISVVVIILIAVGNGRRLKEYYDFKR
jgi:2',3'-cyclic-nucleotide 2'-phosphodiesterase (5'-nucleotidase family)